MKRKRFMAMLLSVTLVISSMYMPGFAADAGAADVTAEPAVEEIAEQISEEAVAGEEDSAAEEAAEAAAGCSICRGNRGRDRAES